MNPRAGSSGVVMFGSHPKGRGFKSRPVHRLSFERFREVLLLLFDRVKKIRYQTQSKFYSRCYLVPITEINTNFKKDHHF